MSTQEFHYTNEIDGRPLMRLQVTFHPDSSHLHVSIVRYLWDVTSFNAPDVQDTVTQSAAKLSRTKVMSLVRNDYAEWGEHYGPYNGWSDAIPAHHRRFLHALACSTLVRLWPELEDDVLLIPEDIEHLKTRV